MSDTRTRLELGGITTDSHEVSVPLIGATYTHPTLGDRPIVRLVPEPLLPAEDLTLGVSGLVAGGRTPVGHTRRRAIGFPAWPILTDPPNAQHALNLVADLERAARTARSKPGQAKDQIDLLITKLDASAPHFLPTFCEQAARVFLGVENRTYAVQYFGKARDAERRHGLPIDEERHREVLLEFAYAGAISAKELTNEAKNLTARAEPGEAYAAFATLCIERVKGGLLPYAGMQKDLTRLAKAAGLDPKAEDVRVVSELLLASSIGNSAEHFWKAYDKAIRGAAADPEIRARLRQLTPKEYATDDWLALLDDVGALDAVRAGEDPGFCQRLIDWNSTWGRDDEYPARWIALMESPGARSEQVTVDGWWIRRLPADLLDVLVANGTRVTVRAARYQSAAISIDSWAERADRRDLSALANDADLAEPLVTGVVAYLREGHSAAPLIASAGTREICLEVLRLNVTQLEETTAPAFGRLSGVAATVALFRGSGDADFETLIEQADLILGNTEKIVADNLRLGMPEELAWPAYEQADAAARRNSRRRWGRDTVVNWPHAILTEGALAWLVTHNAVTDVINWTGHDIDKIVMVGDEVGLAYRDSNWQQRIQWSGAREELTPADTSWGGYSNFHLNLPVAAGRLHAEGLSRPGEAGIIRGDGHLLHDGTHYWRVDQTHYSSDDATLVELDPTTGRTGRTSEPDWLAEQQRRHPDHRLYPSSSQLLPVTDETAGSAFSTADGFHRCAVLVAGGDDLAAIVVDADGTEYRYEHRPGQAHALPFGVMRRPGGGHWLVAQRAFLDAETGELVPIGPPLDDMPSALYHHLSPRDEATSRAMRAATPESVAALVDAARTTPKPADPETPDPLAGVVAQELGCSDALLARLIVELVRESLALGPDPVAAEAARITYQEQPDLTPIRSLLQDTANLSAWGPMNIRDIADGAVAIGISEGGVYGPVTGEYAGTNWSWYELLNHESGLAMLALAPGRTTEEVLALFALWQEFATHGWLTRNISITAFGMPDALARTLKPGRLTDTVLWPQANRQLLVRLDGSTGAVTVSGQILPTEHVTREAVGPRSAEVGALFAIARTLSEAEDRPWPTETAQRLATGLGVPYADACLILAGFPNFSTYGSWSIPAAHRKAMGITAAEAKGAHQRLTSLTRGHRLGLLAAAVPSDDPMRMVREGVPDIPAMAAYWGKHLGVVRASLLPQELADAMPKTITQDDVASLLGEPVSATVSYTERIAAALWLSESLPRQSDLRLRVADGIDTVLKADKPLKQVQLHCDTTAARTALGLPQRPELIDHPQEHTVGAFTVKEIRWEDRVFVDLSQVTSLDDPTLELARGLEETSQTPSSALSHLLLDLDGTLSEHAQSLRTPGDGEGHDPRVIVPDLVSAVAEELEISGDAAAYYLQLLTLAQPTDKNVRAWNGWKTKQVADAGAELVAKDLVIEGKRERAGRSFFLPGGWVKVNNSLPMETWKLEPYRARMPEGATAASLTLRLPLAPRPLERMFKTAWEHSRGDNGPGFEQLETTRRRRR